MVLVFFTTPAPDECRYVSTAFHRVNGERPRGTEKDTISGYWI